MDIGRQQALTLLLLFAGYGAAVFCRASMDVSIPALTADASSGILREDIGSLLGLGTAAYCAGKALNGIMADHVGGVQLFVAAFLISAFANVLIGMAGSFQMIAFLWMMSRFAQSGGWPAMTQVVLTCS